MKTASYSNKSRSVHKCRHQRQKVVFKENLGPVRHFGKRLADKCAAPPPPQDPSSNEQKTKARSLTLPDVNTSLATLNDLMKHSGNANNRHNLIREGDF